MKFPFILVYIISSLLFSSSIGKKVWKTSNGASPLLIAHRGEKVLVPEHTIPAYSLGAILGADFVEPDLCLTKDDQLVCHHDLYLKDSNTDVGSLANFEHLKQHTSTGFKWYIQNFTLQELQTIKIFQKDVGIRPQEFNGIFSIPTFQEFLDTIHDLNYKLGRSIGIAPELKKPAYHNSNRRPHFMEDAFLEVLVRNGYSIQGDSKEDCKAKNTSITCPPVFIQCFELPPLEYLKTKTSYELAMLVEDDDSLLTFEGIERVSKIVNNFYVWKEILHVGRPELISRFNFTYNKEAIEFLGGFVPFEDLPSVVRQLGMKLGIYTIYDSREKSLRVRESDEKDVTKKEELFYYLNLGVDGIFVENVAESREILREYEEALCSSGSERGWVESIILLVSCFSLSVLFMWIF